MLGEVERTSTKDVDVRDKERVREREREREKCSACLIDSNKKNTCQEKKSRVVSDDSIVVNVVATAAAVHWGHGAVELAARKFPKCPRLYLLALDEANDGANYDESTEDEQND